MIHTACYTPRGRKPKPMKKDNFFKHIRALLKEAREMLGEIHETDSNQVLWSW